MKQTMKSFFLITLIAAAGCASKTVKMTPDEVQVYLSKTPGVANSFAEMNGTGKTTQRDYCETLYSGPCWKVECIGNANNMSTTECWKTPYEAFGISSDAKAQTQDPTQLMAACQATTEDPTKRRMSCFEYFAHLQKNPSEKTDVASTKKLLNQFCDMKNVSCTLQYAKFGKGDLNTDGLRSSSYKKGIYQVSSKKNSNTVETYEYSILK